LRRERHRVRLPIVVMSSVPFSFMSRAASTGSWAIRRVFAHDRGSVRVLENTTFDIWVRPSRPGSPCEAMPDIKRYVFAPMSEV
jgi:hypothetical protein